MARTAAGTRWSWVLWKTAAALSLLLVSTGAAGAQTFDDCRSPQPPSIGVSIGRSDPYLDLTSSALEAPVGSVSVRTGSQFAGRADLSLTGPLRVRVEAATSRWNVRETLYDPNAGYRVIAEKSIAHMTTRHLVALVGLRTGRAPVCAHVSIGGGLYAIDLGKTSLRRPGFAIAAGLDFPTGSHGAIQVDVALHLIRTRDAYPIASTAVPVSGLLAGWAYRF